MTQYCPDCNHEFAPDDQNCANCGRPRPPVIQKKYAQILNQPEAAHDDDETEITQPYPVLPPGLREPAPAQIPAAAPVAAPAQKASGFSWALPTESELTGTATAAPAPAKVEEAEEAEPELPTFWTCPHCVSLNPSSADYCENCGAIRPTATPEHRVAAVAPNTPAKPLPVPSSGNPEAANPVQQGPATTKLSPEVMEALAAEDRAAKVSVRLVSSSLSDVGVSRKGGTNEDSFFRVELNRCFESKPESFGFYMVADGMGGQAAGEVASRTAIQTVGPKIMAELAGPWLAGKNFEPPQVAGILEEVISAAHTRLFEYNHEEQIDSGTTITACCVLGNQAIFANVGDSRTYLFRPFKPSQGKGDVTDPVLPIVPKELLDTPPGDRATRKLGDQTDKLNPDKVKQVEEPKLIVERVTRDQSLVQHLVDQGEITLDDVYDDPRRNVILFALGAPDETVPVDTYLRPLEPGDTVLLCSDGLWEMVRDPAIANILVAQPDLDQAARSLVNQANENGGVDNVTVILVKAL